MSYLKDSQQEQPSKPIVYGSIIHLENCAKNGGYLSSSRSVLEEDVSTFVDIAVLTFTFTHLFESRVGSSSWEILPDPDNRSKKIGDSLQYGDRVRLRNIALGSAYLDQFEWTSRLRGALHDEANDIAGVGVFTLDRSLRPNDQVEAEWIVVCAKDPKSKRFVVEGDQIILTSNWLTKHYVDRNNLNPDGIAITRAELTTHKRLSDNETFSKRPEYQGEQMFVFAGAVSGKVNDDDANKWTITQSESTNAFYHLWGRPEGAWLDYGSLCMPEHSSKSLVRLDIAINTTGRDNSLFGKVSYAGTGTFKFKATPISCENDSNRGDCYKVNHYLNEDKLHPNSHYSVKDLVNREREMIKAYPDGEWVFGAQQGKNIVAVDITSADNGRTLTGTITYEGDNSPTPIRAVRPSTTPFQIDNDPLFYDFFKPEDWQQRINTLAVALGSDAEDRHDINSIVSLLADRIDLTELDKTSQQNQINNIGAMKQTMRDYWAEVQRIANGDANETENEADGAIKQVTDQHILPPVHTISKLIRHMTADLEIIERAMQQRRPLGNSAQADSLLITDKLATLSIAPFAGLLGEGKKITPLTYFDQKVFVRLVPYSDEFVFIGLTYDLAVSASSAKSGYNFLPFDLMAIPHEIGHYLYHLENEMTFTQDPDDDTDGADPTTIPPAHHAYRGRGQSYKHRPVRPHTFGWFSQSNAIADNPYLDWCEEVFADLYGCFVAGPFAALGIQAMLTSGDKSRLMTDDAQHPTPILRPYLLSEMLRVLGEKAPEKWGTLRDTAMLLDANWTAILDRWGVVLEDVYNGRPASIIVPNDAYVHLEPFTRVNIARAMQYGRQLIEHFSQKLLDIAQEKGDLSDIPWSSTERTLSRYAHTFSALANNESAVMTQTTLSAHSKYQVNAEAISALSDTIDATAPNYVEIGDGLFETAVGMWHDGGATNPRNPGERSNHGGWIEERSNHGGWIERGDSAIGLTPRGRGRGYSRTNTRPTRATSSRTRGGTTRSSGANRASQQSISKKAR